MTKNTHFKFFLNAAAALLLFLTAALPTAAAEGEAPMSAYDLAGQKVGSVSGTPTDQMVMDFFGKNVTIEYFATDSDMAFALESNKISAYVSDLVSARRKCAVYPDHFVLTPDIKDNDVGFIFNKDDPESIELCGRMQDFIEHCRADGTLAEIDEKWMGLDVSDKTVDIELTGENGTLVWACSTSIGQPWCFLKDGKYVGYEVELATRFCQENGYALEFMDFDVGGMLNAVALGKCDFGGSGTSITPERQESVLFSGPNYTNRFVLIAKADNVRNDAAAAQSGSAYELAGQRIACLTGAPSGSATEKFFDGNVTIEYFSADADMSLALESGKVAGYVSDYVTARRMGVAHPGQITLQPDIMDTDIGFIFNKDNPASIELCGRMHDFIERCRADGTLDDLDEKWMGLDASGQTVDIPLTGENGTLTWACCTSIGQPWCYVQDGKYVGYEVELATRFCQENGYALEFMDFDIGGMINAVVLGKCDFGGSGTSITPERQESVLFSGPNYTNRFVLIAKSADAAAEKSGFFHSVADSFNRTFIREARWKLFVVGIARTLIITVCSVIFGTILGFAVYLACRRGNRFANVLTQFMTWLINGLPTVVLLMILFYIVFGKLSIDGLWVSVVAFTLIFAAAFQSMLRSGVGAIDYGQTEAAYALSYSDRETFFKIILPQAVLHFLPAYKTQIISLLKATSIVGYITVQDLTKVGEIVRANTYEAFFPLIAVAVVYFLLAGILIALVNAITVNTDKRRRTPEDILKGVDQHD